jgi:hypothetical protein
VKKKRTKNPVARFMNDFNKPATHRDKTKYSRKAKHTKAPSEPFLMSIKSIVYTSKIA